MQYTREDGIAVLSLPNVEGRRRAFLSRELVSALRAALAVAIKEPDITGIVIGGPKPGFFSVDRSPRPEAGAAMLQSADTGLAELGREIENSPKPVVFVLRGMVQDDALALALACHGRVASTNARISLGAVRQGLVPGGGVTQRLSRMIGAGTALDLMLSGQEIPVSSGVLRGLFRKIVGRNAVGEAVQAARTMAAETMPQDWPGFADPAQYQADIATRRAKLGSLPPEAKAIFDCVEAAQLLPIDAGLEMEAALCQELAESARAQALTYVVALESRQEEPDARQDPVTILGDGALAIELTLNVLAAGGEVHIAEQHQGGAKRALEQVRLHLQGEVHAGRIDRAVAQERGERLSGGNSDYALAEAGFVIEACGVGADKAPAVIAHVVEKTDGSAPLLFTSGVALHARQIAAQMHGRVMGLALHKAPSSNGLAEFVLGAEGSPQASAAVRAEEKLRQMGFQVVHARPENGLIAGALKAALFSAGEWCVAQGARPDQVDRAMGRPRGPFCQADGEGLAVQADRCAALGMGARHGGLARMFVARGRGGGAGKPGVLSYEAGKSDGVLGKDAATIIDEWRGGMARADLSDEMIRRRIWTALFGAGIRLLERGVAQNLGDIDLAALVALGVPRASGGPMKAGEQRGLLQVKAELDHWQSDAPDLWAPSGLLEDMIKNGRGIRA